MWTLISTARNSVGTVQVQRSRSCAGGLLCDCKSRRPSSCQDRCTRCGHCSPTLLTSQYRRNCRYQVGVPTPSHRRTRVQLRKQSSCSLSLLCILLPLRLVDEPPC